MNTVWDILYARRPVLNYVSPPVCEVIFSGSSNPVIVLSEPLIGRVTGLRLGGFGGFQLTWNAFPGALCYNVYFIGGDDVAVILAQCVTDPTFILPDLGPGEIVVTPVTLDGEGPPSDPLPAPTGGGGGTSTVTAESQCALTSRVGFPGFFRIARETGDTIGNLTVNFTLTGDAVNGVDYELVPLSAQIPNGMDFVLVPIIPKNPIVGSKELVLTLVESLTYAVGAPSVATMEIRQPIYQLVDYGGAQPLLTPPGDVPEADWCEWDGTFNFQEGPFGTGEAVYSYTDFDGTKYFPDATVGGKQLWWAVIIGPYSVGVVWQLGIFCQTEDGSVRYVWSGFKNTGATGAGSYTASGGGSASDPRPTLEVELA